MWDQNPGTLMDSLLKNVLLTAVGFLLVLSAAVAQQDSPQTGSATGPATSSSPVAVPGNSSGTGAVKADETETMGPESAPDDRSMIPEDADDDQSMTPEDASAADETAATRGRSSRAPRRTMRRGSTAPTRRDPDASRAAPAR